MYRSRKQDRILKDDANAISPGFWREIADIYTTTINCKAHVQVVKLTFTVERHFARIWIVEPTDELLYRAFTATARSAVGCLSSIQVKCQNRTYTKATLVPGSIVKSTPFKTSTSFRLG